MKRILLIVSGGIAAYKALELVRLLSKAGYGVRCVLTQAGGKICYPDGVAGALGGEGPYGFVLPHR